MINNTLYIYVMSIVDNGSIAEYTTTEEELNEYSTVDEFLTDHNIDTRYGNFMVTHHRIEKIEQCGKL